MQQEIVIWNHRCSNAFEVRCDGVILVRADDPDKILIHAYKELLEKLGYKVAVFSEG